MPRLIINAVLPLPSEQGRFARCNFFLEERYSNGKTDTKQISVFRAQGVGWDRQEFVEHVCQVLDELDKIYGYQGALTL